MLVREHHRSCLWLTQLAVAGTGTLNEDSHDIAAAKNFSRVVNRSHVPASALYRNAAKGPQKPGERLVLKQLRLGEKINLALFDARETKRIGNAKMIGTENKIGILRHIFPSLDTIWNKRPDNRLRHDLSKRIKRRFFVSFLLPAHTVTPPPFSSAQQSDPQPHPA